MHQRVVTEAGRTAVDLQSPAELSELQHGLHALRVVPPGHLVLVALLLVGVDEGVAQLAVGKQCGVGEPPVALLPRQGLEGVAAGQGDPEGCGPVLHGQGVAGSSPDGRLGHVGGHHVHGVLEVDEVVALVDVKVPGVLQVRRVFRDVDERVLRHDGGVVGAVVDPQLAHVADERVEVVIGGQVGAGQHLAERGSPTGLESAGVQLSPDHVHLAHVVDVVELQLLVDGEPDQGHLVPVHQHRRLPQRHHLEQ